MAAITGVAITWPDYRGGNSHNNTSCGIVEVHFAEEYGIDVYSFRATAAWANDSDKLLTSFPTTREVC